MRAFRADKRLYTVGDEIRTAADYVARFNRSRRLFELVLNLLRPRGLPPRQTSLFVFESVTEAEKHWVKLSGGKLYEVDVSDDSIIHRGDMALLERAFQSEGWLARIVSFRRYWRGELSLNPVIEITVPVATVSRVISVDDEERRRALIRIYKLASD